MNASSPVTAELPKVLRDITTERARQIALGYTAEHDDTHSTEELVDAALVYVSDDEPLDRDLILKAAAILVAAVEAIDREDG